MPRSKTPNRCPYCRPRERCVHVLLVVDVTFREAVDGPLREWFNGKWSALLEQHESDDDWDESGPFSQLLERVESLADCAPPSQDCDGEPGQSSAMQRFYCESAGRVAVAVSGVLADHR